jgi:hypothetical protein
MPPFKQARTCSAMDTDPSGSYATSLESASRSMSRSAGSWRSRSRVATPPGSKLRGSPRIGITTTAFAGSSQAQATTTGLGSTFALHEAAGAPVSGHVVTTGLHNSSIMPAHVPVGLPFPAYVDPAGLAFGASGASISATPTTLELGVPTIPISMPTAPVLPRSFKYIHSFMLHLWQKLIQATPTHSRRRQLPKLTN